MHQLWLATSKVAELSSPDALVALITVEGLLFTALAVSVTLAGETKTGRPKIVRGPKLAWSITGTIILVSFGAIMAWLELFADHCPSGFRSNAIAAAIMVGIIVQPVLAGWISSGVK
ncbi:MAG TPA: hypothetical protein VGN84_11235 [Solirubrobacterales bacterium]|jgi:hypothetical protein|nr:hypothetical protein [Solirubrobacterales bacterium]